MQNCPQLVLAHFAILRANAVVVPVNPMNRAEELKHYITDPQALVAITTADLAPELAKASNALASAQRLRHCWSPSSQRLLMPMLRVPTHRRPGTIGCAPAMDCRSWRAARCMAGRPWPAQTLRQILLVGPDDLAVLPYTSGTTGLPKGCMHPHRTLMHNAVASSLWGNATSENVTLAVVPMFHITGMVSMMHATIYSGGTLVIMPRWDRELAGRLISRWKVTSGPTFPPWSST
jgi:fatty-acyl-CoA synthase